MKTWKRFGAGALAAVMAVSSFVFVPVTDVKAAEIVETNWAAGRNATVNDQEADYWGADKAVDGIVNRDEETKENQSRWATHTSSYQTPKTLIVDLGVERIFDRFVIEWERTNITDFEIAVSDRKDSGWKDVYVKEDGKNIESVTSDIQLDEELGARYVRLTVDGYTSNPGSWQSVSLYEFEVLGTVENLSLGAAALTDGSEESELGAENAIDGDDTTRWASSYGRGAHWIGIDYGREETVQTIKVHWERTNALEYRIETSADGTNWETVKSFNTKPISFHENIILDEPVKTQYLRLYIEDFDSSGAPEWGENVDWETISVYELGTYTEVIEEPGPLADPGSIVGNLVVPEAIEGTVGSLDMPEVPKGYAINFVGADYEQIIDRDLTVYEPLVTKTVKMNFNVEEATNGENSADSREYSITVTGKYETEEGDNEDPEVIPALAEWKGAKGGDFSINEGSRIIIDSKDEAVLAPVAEEFQKDYKDVTGNEIEIVYADRADAGDFFFTLEEGKGLQEEGYYMNIGEVVEIQAEAAPGAYWSTRTILQILGQTGGTIPMGEVRDYPKYEVRGFMMDVARRPFSKETIEEVAKTMRWYKMNDFQLHLNDNYIALESYPDSASAMTAYEGFRLESDIKKGGNGGLNQADLTSDDIFWTKDEMRSMIQDARKIGMNIVPEFDTPAHSLPFTKVRPDLRMGTYGRDNDHFNLSDKYDQSFEFITGVWDEYMEGENPVFDQDTIVNIGTDEYSATYTEEFRKFTDDLLGFVQDKGNPVRLWGSLTARSGSTPVRSENIQMNIWSDGWANPREMYEQGYDLIDMNDGNVYSVPAAGYYHDYLNKQYLYDYDPAERMGVPAGSEQMLGGAYALWNDMVDLQANGLSEMEIYDRFNDAAPVYAASLWGRQGDMSLEETETKSDEIGEAPCTNAYDKVESKTGETLNYDFEDGLTDGSENGYDAGEAVDAEVENGTLVLNGEESYVSTPVDRIGPGSELTFDITLTKQAAPGEVLFEADAEYGTFDIRVMEDETLGFTREDYEYSFGYTLPEDRKVTLSIQAKEGKTVLEAEGQTYNAVGSYTYEGNLKARALTRSSMSIPIERIGSKTNAVSAVIDNVSVSTDIKSIAGSAVPPEKCVVTTDNENPEDGSEGPVSLAFDKNPSTFWHTQYDPDYKALPAEVVIALPEKTDVNGFYYLPRQEGSNGYIAEYSLYYENETGEWESLVEKGTWEKNGDEKTATFRPVKTSKIKLIVSEGEGGYASAAEIRVLAGTEDYRNAEVIAKIDELKGLLTASINTDEKMAALQEAIEAVEAKVDDTTLVEENLAELESAYEAFMAKEEGKVRIGSFNIAAGTTPDVELMRQQLEKYYVDIAGVQEVDKYTWRNPYDMLAVFQGDIYPDIFYSKAIDYEGGEYGIGTISKAPLMDGTTTMLESAGNEQRIFQRNVVELDGHEVAFYNLHLSKESTELRHEQMNTVKAAMEADLVEYKIVVGDFNTDQYYEEFEEVFGEDYNIANGMNGIFFDTFNGVDETMKVDSVDNVITTKNIEIEVVQMIDNKLSDHNMFFADVTFKEESSADKTSLNMVIAMTEELAGEQEQNGAYTEESWAAAEAALAAAKALAEDVNASQEEVDTAFLDLITACNLLENEVQRIGLHAAINGAKAILADEAGLSQYMEERVQAVRTALEEAEKVYAEAANQTTVNAATRKLLDAVTSLVVTQEDTRLDIIIQLAEQLLAKAEQYTESSIAELETALEEAKLVQADGQASGEVITDAYNRLAEAITGLVRLAEKSELSNAIEKARELLADSGRYVEDTLTGLEEETEKAELVLEDENADASAVGEAVKNLVAEILKARLRGDVNLDGNVDTADSAEVLQYAAECKELTEEQHKAADVNEDGLSDSSDAAGILQFAAEKITEF
ncbi:discoidin domain-containing protein [Robinsoniella peoriensis]|uniref:discoidin domain-containing protein n=1 Tax=Robinsoniella peoriensis TaxID=180332 RepID=UPI00375102F0